MRISDWSSDVCSSDLEDYIQDNEITETGDVRTALVEEKRFDIWIEEANYGNADPFPDFARQHGLAFEHRWGSGGGFGPGGIIHAPGEEDLEYKGTFDDGPALTASELKRLKHDHIQQRSEEHTYELQTLTRISYAAFSL